ncbi:hypothetical protein EG327_005758 [Venturia inaequalis]|uniref:Bicarbonate transporter-like transmembrane domain-containing protein n=1 Tax=Venturia inaequalis TaxID=5025 RepID=A0A8H3Z1Z5_VENIN|nr:hypothetical protein EG327_005758 [Venturia inaequalis]
MLYAREYKWETEPSGWRQNRNAQPFRGIIHDVRRRVPWYWSDVRDGFNYRTFAATVRMYFVNLLPALAFQLDMNHNTGGFYGINEALFSSALAAMVFSTMAAQPLTIVGITGLISLFNYTIYDIIKLHDVSLFPAFMVWVGIWSAITHWITAIFNWCDYMRYVTDYSSNTFALYVVKGVEELSINFYDERITNGFMSVMIGILFTLTVYFLEKIRSTTLFTESARELLSDYAYPDLVTFLETFAAHISNVSQSRNPGIQLFLGLMFGMLVTLLFYYDHNLSSLTAQARHFPLRKPAGFHWDFFLLGWTTIIAAIVGVPFPNGLVPQAPVHTDALTTYKDVVEVTNTSDGEQIFTKKTVATHVSEQRMSHFLMGLLIIGTMTRPLLVVLGTMPRAVLSGVFFIVGWGSIEGNGIISNLLFLVTEKRFVQPSNPLLKISKKRILLFTTFQLFTWAASVAISQTIAAIGFPVIVTALIPFRVFVIPKIFERWELEILDALTADSDVVLASLGGKPTMRESKDLEGADQGGNSSVQRGGSETDEKQGEKDGGNEETRQRKRHAGSDDGDGVAHGMGHSD